MLTAMKSFQVKDRWMRYSEFVPRLFNLCLSLGFEAGKIMPSRAFCSDENQGFPIVLLTQHFGVFPFNHGRVGGIVATDRHGPHSHHGKDIVIVQASHVGYDPDSEKFGTYRRIQTEHNEITTDCGKICGVCDWYHKEYAFAAENIFLTREEGENLVVIDNQLLQDERPEGLFLALGSMLDANQALTTEASRVYSTAKGYKAAAEFTARLPNEIWQEGKKTPIGHWLRPDLFHFKRPIAAQVEDQDQLERNLFPVMPAIVTSESPALEAAKFNTIVEFDRAFRTITRSNDYQGKNLLFISGINIDISPEPGQIFPLTKFVPWAAYVQSEDGKSYTMEQEELVNRLKEQSSENSYQIDLEKAIQDMMDAQEIQISI